VTGELQGLVASSSDAAQLHAPVPALLLELHTALGALCAAVTTATERGRRPFRPGPDWQSRLGELAYGVYLLADQTGVSLDDAVRATSGYVHQRAQQTRASDANDWPIQQ